MKVNLIIYNLKSKMRTLIFSLLLLVVLANSKVVVDLTADPDPIYENILEMGIGEKFVLQLRENPSTGYQWVIVDEELEKEGLKGVVKLVSSDFKRDEVKR